MRAVLLGAVLLSALVATAAEGHLRPQGAWGGVDAPTELLSGGAATGAASGLAVVGHNNIGGRGYNADV